MIPPKEEKKCYRLDEIPAYMKERYRRVALVAHDRHLEGLEDDGETLIISSDWLLWQRCLNEGRHCVHIDLGLLGWDDGGRGNDTYLRADDWIYVDDRDITRFHGVSLGRKLFLGVALLICDYEKLNRSLAALVEKFHPEEIVFYEFRTEVSFLDVHGRFNIVTEIAANSEIGVVDRRDPLDDLDPEFPRAANHNTRVPPGKTLKDHLRAFLSDTFEVVFSAISLARRFFMRDRKTVLMLNTALTGIPLLEKFDGKGIAPLYLAKWFPNKKNLLFLASYILKGGMLVGALRPGLSKEDEKAIADIETAMKVAWEQPAQGLKAEVRRYILSEIIGKKRFRPVAMDVKWAERILDRHKPNEIFSDSLNSALVSTFLELARERGISTTGSFHSPCPWDQRFAICGCDTRTPPLVERFFTWGQNHEDWLRTISAKVESLRTGSPISGFIQGKEPVQGSGDRVLVTQYFLSFFDFLTPPSNEYQFFVKTIRMLRELGFKEIRLRLHPGVPKRLYYDRIAEYFGFDYEMDDRGSFNNCLDWADMVIGIPTSGSMLEVLSSGKPFYPFLLQPHSVNTNYLKESHVFSSFDELGKNVETRSAPNLRKLLNDLTSFKDIPDPIHGTWAALEEQRPKPLLH